MPVRKGLSYLQMTLAKCRDMGRIVDKTEYFNPYGGARINGKPTGVRVDVFNFIDALAIGPVFLTEHDAILVDPMKRSKIIAIQSTGPSGHAAHKKKILENEYAKRWLECGGYIELWSWRKLLKERGGRLKIWMPRIERITLEQMGADVTTNPAPTPAISI